MRQYIYKFTAKGLALGAEIVIVWDLQEGARRMAKRWLLDNGLGTKSLRLESKEKFYGEQLVHAWNGDY